MWYGVWKRLLVFPPNPFSTYVLLIKPFIFIWAHGCPRGKLHFLTLPCSWEWPSNSILPKGIQVAVMYDYLWTLICEKSKPVSPHIPPPSCLSLDKVILGGDNKLSSLSLGTTEIKDLARKLPQSAIRVEVLNFRNYPISMETCF